MILAIQEAVVTFVIVFSVFTTSIWLAAKLLGDEGSFLEFGVVAVVSSFVCLVPYVGVYLAFVVYFWLLWRLMDLGFLRAAVIFSLAISIDVGALQIADSLGAAALVGIGA